MNAEIRAAATQRGVSRLCHVTPLRNLVHIANGDGLLSTKELFESERGNFNQQDLARLDGYPNHISCSIEYPNGWYLRRRRGDTARDAPLFPDWVCLTLDPKHLWADTTLLCPRNAAAEGGRLVSRGTDAFESLYEAVVKGAGGQSFRRNKLPPACPTDDQAEVLVYQHVPLNDIQHVIVADEAQARRTIVGLDQINLRNGLFRFRICPEFFKPQQLSSLIRSGRHPAEVDWNLRGDQR